MVKRDKDFMLYLLGLAEEAQANDSDECTLSYEKNGFVFKCSMKFELYERVNE